MAVNTQQIVGENTQQAVKTKRDLALDRLKKRHPEAEYGDDESIYGAINDDYDEDQRAIEGYKANEKAMSDMMTSDPRSAALLQSMKSGKNPWTELVRNFGDDAIDYFTDPENAEEVGEAQAEYLKRVAEGNKLDEEYKKNMEASLSVFEQMDKEFGEELTNELISKMFVVANDVIRGRFTKEALDMFRLASSHDKDVEEAAHEGEVKGRNANITKHMRLKKKDDGTADLDSAVADGNEENGQRPKTALDKMSSGASIWKRGGEKRISMR